MASNRSVIALGSRSLAVALLEDEVLESLGGSASAGSLQGVGIDVSAGDVSAAANQTGGDQGDLAYAAADIEHPHSGRNAGAAEKILRNGIQHGSLERQSPTLPVGASHHVFGIGGCECQVWRARV